MSRIICFQYLLVKEQIRSLGVIAKSREGVCHVGLDSLVFGSENAPVTWSIIPWIFLADHVILSRLLLGLHIYHIKHRTLRGYFFDTQASNWCEGVCLWAILFDIGALKIMCHGESVCGRSRF